MKFLKDISSFIFLLFVFPSLQTDPSFRAKYSQGMDKDNEEIIYRILSSEDPKNAIVVHLSVYILGGLLLGGILREIKKKLTIPYSPLVLGVGIIIGLVHQELGYFGDIVKLVNNIDPHALLLIFIPALVFESAYNTDGYVMSKSKWQVAMLAGPGVLLSSVCIAFFLRYCLFYQDDLTIWESLVIGAIVSATDPVAVVALLKELGTSVKFSTILEGESLFNDGTAYVLFLVCLDSVKDGFQLLPSILKFVQLTLGGPLFGLVVGFISVLWLRNLRRDIMLIMLVTVFATYFVFLMSEVFLHVSGILALVTMGMYIGTYAKANFSHENKHAIHMVWGFGSFSLETILFLITGTYIGDIIPELGERGLTLNDGWKCVIFFIFLVVIRFLILLVQMPILNMVGYQIPLRSIMILSYGGLRGAIALSLAMIVTVDEQLDQKFRILCLFYTVVTIILTVFVNGNTMKLLMWATGFLEEKPLRVLMKEKLKMRMVRVTKEKLAKLERLSLRNPEYKGADWDEIKRMIEIEEDENKVIKFFVEYNKNPNSGKGHKMMGQKKQEEKRIYNLRAESHRRKTLQSSGANDSGNRQRAFKRQKTVEEKIREQMEVDPLSLVGGDLSPLNTRGISLKSKKSNSGRKKKNKNTDDVTFKKEEDTEQLLMELRLRVYSLVKHEVTEMHEHYEYDSYEANAIENLCDYCSDDLTQPISLYIKSDGFIIGSIKLKACFYLMKVPLLHIWASKKYYGMIFFEYRAMSAIIKALHHIMDDLDVFSSEFEFSNTIEIIKEEIEIAMMDCDEHRHSMVSKLHSLVKIIKTKQTATNLVLQQREQVHQYKKFGLIDSTFEEEWLEKLYLKLRRIKESSITSEILEDAETNKLSSKANTFRNNFHLMDYLSSDELNDVASNLKEVTYQRGQTILTKGEPATYIFFLNSGIAEEASNRLKIAYPGFFYNISGVCKDPDAPTMHNHLIARRKCTFFILEIGKLF